MAEIFFSWILLIHIVDCDLACWMWLNELFLNFVPFGLLCIIRFLWSSSCFEVFCSYLSVHHRAKSKSFAWWFDGQYLVNGFVTELQVNFLSPQSRKKCLIQPNHIIYFLGVRSQGKPNCIFQDRTPIYRRLWCFSNVGNHCYVRLSLYILFSFSSTPWTCFMTIRSI